MALTAVVEATNVILVASLVSYLLTGQMNIALSRAVEVLTQWGLVNDPQHLSLKFLFYVALSNLISAVLGIVNIFFLSHMAANAGQRLANRILTVFLRADSDGILATGPSSVTKLLTLEVNRVIDYIFQNFAQVNARIYTVLVISGVLIYTSASAFFLSVTLFILSYLTLTLLLRRRLAAFGTSISQLNAKRLKLLEEMSTGYKEIKSLAAETFFESSLSQIHLGYATLYRNLNLIYNIPRFAIEMIIFVCLLSLAAISLLFHEQTVALDVSHFLPIFGLAALKLLPILQQLYTGYAQVHAHSSAAVVISRFLLQYDISYSKRNDMRHTQRRVSLPLHCFDKSTDKLTIDALTFRYSKQAERFSFSFQLQRGVINFVVGPSGSGKTTLLETFSGLRSPESGTLVVGEDTFDLKAISLREACSYSTQRSFLVDGTVKENLTLGRNVDEDTIRAALDAAHIRGFVDSLPQELLTAVGVGIRDFSVGQLQRLGLARHLAAGRPILILDEPTSNLDSNIGDLVFASLREISKDIFVVCVTHDTVRIRSYDNVIHVSGGAVRAV